MSMPLRLSGYLDARGARYEVRAHQPSRSSAETARMAHILPHRLAKSVIVEDDSRCMMAVLPADRTVMLGHLARLLGRKDLRLSDENRIAMLFDDCDQGAVPPVGMAWGLETIVDDALEASDVVYLESGDHAHLLQMSHDQFHALMSTAQHGHFCKAPLP
ncbi:YbaK/EbsC family protein [Polaromonas sp.]|jgi:Ala-tRNA(Pro) deacylase|uniref:aminoacyl-tRNA deacylase n=1 Tax=Polaromonas sp. TaxID=1869339 RepID=UPI002CA8520C|nr:YbaK/EbsC family protein [Polaromonas sp.]HQS30549.1 YbaK/EbsC family protein [Polaromonas sp.]HQS89487.1 YbaK/EbsC family protein [Polaromonas sp.]